MNSKVQIDQPAPDFSLTTFNGDMVELSAYRNEKNVLLVFNRGFTWPFCRRHLSQLRLDHSKFLERETAILVIGPEGSEVFKRYWKENNLPFIGLPDPDHKIIKLYGQQIKIFKFGRMPAQAIIDRDGILRYLHYGNSMSDIPKNIELLDILEKINLEQANFG